MGTDRLSEADRELIEAMERTSAGGSVRSLMLAGAKRLRELASQPGKEVVCNAGSAQSSDPRNATPPGVVTTAPGDSAHAYEAAYEAYRLLTHEMLHGGGLGGRCGLAQHVLSEVFTTKTNLATEEQMPSVYIERDALKSDNTRLREEVDRWKREAEAARNILHESGRERNVNHVLAVSPEIGRAAYKAARAAVDARIDLGEQP